MLEVSDNSRPTGRNPNGHQPSADSELYRKRFGGRGFKASPELLRFGRQCNLTPSLT